MTDLLKKNTYNKMWLDQTNVKLFFTWTANQLINLEFIIITVTKNKEKKERKKNTQKDKSIKKIMIILC